MTQPAGILNLNKPMGMTSHDVVKHVRRITGIRKVGHAGTLDPLATGVLIVCVGQATRLIEYLMSSRKQYQARVWFGRTTETLDGEGQILTEQDVTHLTADDVQAILPDFVGELAQVPPIYSALKRDGQPLYKLARAGKTVELKPRPVTIYDLAWLDWQSPELTLNVTCSVGTYIRSLARDFGERVGVGAHLSGLTRTASGDWSLADSVSLEQLADDWQTHLRPLPLAVQHLPQQVLNETQIIETQQGKQLSLDAPISGDKLVGLTTDGQLVAIYHRVDPLWQPKKVFHLS